MSHPPPPRAAHEDNQQISKRAEPQQVYVGGRQYESETTEAFDSPHRLTPRVALLNAVSLAGKALTLNASSTNRKALMFEPGTEFKRWTSPRFPLCF